MTQHAIRIIGGQYRRTRIPVTHTTDLRPTSDRIRETLFNWLRHFWGNDFSQKHVLDLFAGTGALGFEAVSHGAAFVQLVERNPKAVQVLRQFRNKLNAPQVRIHQGDAMHVVERSTHQYDLVFLDPPFKQGWFERLWPILPNVLAPNALVYVEAEHALEIPAQYHSLRQQKAGHVHYQLLKFDASAKKDNNADSTP
ncbi:MAG TPA: 16S rRNA (guanine(966)-N(2))-methyltransferase RsmD [Paenalcaligenes sp.]|nr:16S rRNA (guanine(966)-N(2))-methyltransferase RsmD [Paenalcaligenes sp.]